MDKQKFKNITRLVINNLEGGYFHPNMRTANPTKFGPYHRSGETMFGLDRHAGHGLYYSTPQKKDANGKSLDVLSNLKNIESGVYNYKTPEAREFWQTIDRANAKNTWKWNFKGGPLQEKLTDLASEIMYPQYDSYTKNFIKDQKTIDAINNNDKLLFHFIYGLWNGPAWFKKFGEDINKAIKRGVTNTNDLINVALYSRLKEGLKPGSPANSLIKQGGEKIKTLFNKNIFTNIDTPEKKKISIIAILLLIGGGFFIYKKFIKKK